MAPNATYNSTELLQEDVKKILIQPLEKASVILANGVRIFDTDGSPVRIPKLLGMTVAPTWVGEGEDIPDTTQGNFDEIKLMPRGMKSIKVLTKVTEELIRQSVVAIDSALAARLVRDVSAGIDDAFITGTGNPVNGTDTTPRGLLNQPGTTNLLAVGDVTLDDLHDATAIVMGLNADVTKMRWLMTSRTFVSLRKLKSTDGKYLLEPDATANSIYRLLGIPVVITNRIPMNGGAGSDESAIILADMSTIAVARDTAPSVRFLTELYAAAGQVGIRVIARYDIAPMLPEAVVILRGVTN